MNIIYYTLKNQILYFMMEIISTFIKVIPIIYRPFQSIIILFTSFLMTGKKVLNMIDCLCSYKNHIINNKNKLFAHPIFIICH